MIKTNSYKINKKLIFPLIFVLIVIFTFLIITIDTKKILLNEIDAFQSRFVSFSSHVQLFDSGNIQGIRNVKVNDIIPGGKQLLSVLFDDIISNKNKSLPEIKLFIKFRNLNKIYNDIENATYIGNNYKPKYVPCKISDGTKIFKCKVRLKGELIDHWNSKIRFSLRVSIKNGFIYGLKEFSIQKPLSRQFPYDQAFAYINTELGGLSNNDQRFYNIKMNSENWGVMNVEPNVDDRFIELRKLKRSGVFRISNQDNRIYYKKDKILFDNHFISDPTIFLSQKGSEDKILQDKRSREIYSHILYNMNYKNPKIFDRDKMIDSFMLSLVWGYLHPLTNANSLYTWNSYTKKLEPILTDQSIWRDIEDEIKYIKILPYEYSLIFSQYPLTKNEYKKSLDKIIFFLKNNDPLKIVNNLKDKYFINDRHKTITPLHKNTKFLKNNSSKVIYWINNLSSTDNIDKTSKNYKFPGKVELNNEFLKFFHFTNGEIKFFNLMSDPVKVSDLVFEDKKIIINQFIPASKENNLGFIKISTNILGQQDNKILVNGEFQNIKKTFLNQYSLFNKTHLNEDNFIRGGEICELKSDQNFCYISGKHIISTHVVFNKKVIIENGAEIILKNNSDIIFENSVEMNGSKIHPIYISGKGSITVLNNHNSYNSSFINFVKFDNLTTPSIPLNKLTGSVNLYGGDNIISNSTFSNGNSEDQLNIVHSHILVTDVKFINAKSDSFDCDFCKGDISSTSFSRAKGDALDISGSDLTISNIIVNSANDKAISIGENSQVDIFNAVIKKSATGLAVKDGSNVNVENITLQDIFFDAFMTYIKKPFYTNNTTLNVFGLLNLEKIDGSLCIRQKNTLLIIENDHCVETHIDVENLYKSGRMKK